MNRQIIEATNGWILVSRISDTAAMGVVASAAADLGLVGYEMTLLTQRLGDVMSPELDRPAEERRAVGAMSGPMTEHA